MDREFHKILRDRKEATVRYDAETEAIWLYGNPRECPCLNPSMLEELHEVQMDIANYFKHNNMKVKTPIKFFVYASQTPNVYSYGGNLGMLVDVIKKKDRNKLEQCAKSVINAIYFNSTHLNLPLYTLTLVEGDAFGGGFEMALSFDAIFAEEQSRYGLQQARFGIFSGMGYSSLVRKVGLANADIIIGSTKTYNAKDIQSMGAITDIAKNGEGKTSIDKFMKRYRKSFNINQALHAAKLRYAPFKFSELEYMAELWINSILNMEESNFKMLQKLSESQDKNNESIEYRLRTKQDRRFDSVIDGFPLTDADGNTIEQDRRRSRDPRELDT